MSFQELLSKDYQKNILPMGARVGVILGNLYIFLFYSGWQYKGQFGPVISHLENGIPVEEAMKSFSTIDMTVVMLAVVVCVHQLSFRRPDIDSFNEIMTFPASEKNWTILLLICCIFKFFYQLPTKETGVLGCWNDSSWIWLLKVNKSYNSDWKSVKNNRFWLSSMPDEWMCVVSNLILICSSITCVFSSFTFKYQIRNAEREMVNQLLSYALGLNIFMAVISVVMVVFTQDMKYLGSFFLLAFVLDMIRITWNSYMRVKGSSQKLEIGDYIVSLKWISIATFGLVLFSSYYAYLLEEVFDFRRSNSIYKISSYFLLFHRNDNESGYVGFCHLDHNTHSSVYGGMFLYDRLLF